MEKISRLIQSSDSWAFQQNKKYKIKRTFSLNAKINWTWKKKFSINISKIKVAFRKEKITCTRGWIHSCNEVKLSNLVRKKKTRRTKWRPLGESCEEENSKFKEEKLNNNVIYSNGNEN